MTPVKKIVCGVEILCRFFRFYCIGFPNSIQTEASGNINLDNVVQYAETGVDFVSVGAIIHSASPLDMSLVTS